mmetsp:Transcript_28114/g.64686  ORF Transcript_28114/g.64686 Transcript_28114/m.64686 type:complete len:187 (-) Transcript_28114:1897-2457(-)
MGLSFVPVVLVGSEWRAGERGVVYMGGTTLRSDNKVLGADDLNTSLLSHDDSVFYLKYSRAHEILNVNTALNDSEVLFTTTAPHGFAVGETVHIGGGVVDPNFVVGGTLTPAELLGEFVVATAPTTTTFTVDTGVNATGFETEAFTPHVRVDRYRYIDLAGTSVTWEQSTTPPTASHSNLIEPFFS